MIASLAGTLEGRTPDYLVVNVGGVGFKVFTTAKTGSSVAIGEQLQVFTTLHVRQDLIALYGFESDEERRMFELLLTVAGVGPRVAIALLSATPLQTLRAAVAAGDMEPLMRISGVGKKVAGRIVLELRGKIPTEIIPRAQSSREAEVVAALTGLGYSPSEAEGAVQAAIAETDASIEEKVLAALRHLAKV